MAHNCSNYYVSRSKPWPISSEQTAIPAKIIGQHGVARHGEGTVGTEQ